LELCSAKNTLASISNLVIESMLRLFFQLALLARGFSIRMKLSWLDGVRPTPEEPIHLK